MRRSLSTRPAAPRPETGTSERTRSTETVAPSAWREPSWQLVEAALVGVEQLGQTVGERIGVEVLPVGRQAGEPYGADPQRPSRDVPHRAKDLFLS
jgi:hypothetical protein